MVRLVINGIEHDIDAGQGRVLLDILREDLGLTGTKYGCGEGACGACTVLVNGFAERSCLLRADQLDGATITTIEGLSHDDRLHPVQAAFVTTRALQCGFCTPGMVMSAVSLLRHNAAPDDAAIRAAMAGNICRCGGYPQIVRAIHLAAGQHAPGDQLATSALPRTCTARSHDTPTACDGTAVTRDDTAMTRSGTGRQAGAADGTTHWTAVLRLPDTVRESRGWGWSTPGGALLTIDAAGCVTAYTGKVDGGQGNRVALARLVAAELGVPVTAVLVTMGDTQCTPLDFGTVGSRSIPDAGRALRLLAAALRREFIGEAARRWQANAEDLTLGDGMIRHVATGRSVPLHVLVADGARTIHADPEEQLSGAPPGLADIDDAGVRPSLVAAVTGAKRFPSDLSLPGMWHGVVLRPPCHGATVATVDAAAARRLPDVAVVVDGDFVAVAAPTRQAAQHALSLIQVDWRTTPQPSQTELEAYLRAHPYDAQPGWGGSGRQAGDVEAGAAAADIRLAATYTTAYLAHAPMETRVAVAQVGAQAATVWVGTQRPFAVRSAVAAALGLAEAQVRVVVPDFGGGFGGKHTPDVAVEAARLAYAAQRPVRVCWTREEEFSWAYFRPAAVIDIRSGVNRDGQLISWDFININSGAAALTAPYAVPNVREQYQAAHSPLPQGSYRALAATANTFARESHIDEIAAALRIDPVELRLRHLVDDRLAQVLVAVAERVDWANRTDAPGEGLGIACGVEKDARVAMVAKVRVNDDGTLHVVHLVTAVDCGAIVDPTGLRNQVVGATIMGLGGALYEAVAFDQGRVTNASFTTYRVPRFPDIPPIDVLTLDRPDCPSAGAGETPIIAVAPAIANAIFAATGQRVRSLPLTRDGRLHG